MNDLEESTERTLQLLDRIEELEEIIRRFKRLPIHSDTLGHGKLWDDAEAIVPHKKGEEPRYPPNFIDALAHREAQTPCNHVSLTPHCTLGWQGRNEAGANTFRCIMCGVESDGVKPGVCKHEHVERGNCEDCGKRLYEGDAEY